jgi:hypothetical protein
MAIEREWVVFSTAVEDGVLMLECAKTGAFGIVRNSSKEEWSAAFTAPDSPYRWNGGDDRVELIHERGDKLSQQKVLFEDIGFTKVRIEFHKKQEPGCYKIKRNCLMGCECGANLSKSGKPNLQLAIDDILCFNDAKHIGISGRGCSGRTIEDGPEKWVFEIDARICQAVSNGK